MQGQHLYEYAVIRIVPRMEREEFINAGVVLYCARLKYLKALYRIDPARLAAFASQVDIGEADAYLQALAHICAAHKDGGPIARLPIAERFRWLTATRSTVVQCSKVHPGLCGDAEETLERLFGELVG